MYSVPFRLAEALISVWDCVEEIYLWNHTTAFILKKFVIVLQSSLRRWVVTPWSDRRWCFQTLHVNYLGLSGGALSVNWLHGDSPNVLTKRRSAFRLGREVVAGNLLHMQGLEHITCVGWHFRRWAFVCHWLSQSDLVRRHIILQDSVVSSGRESFSRIAKGFNSI